MTTAAKFGKGTTLSRNGNLIAQITSIGGIEVTQEAIDATNYDSPDDYREKIFGLLDAGTVTIEGDFKPDDANGQLGLRSDMESHIAQNFVLNIVPLATAWTFQAGVTRFGVRPPMDGKVTFAAELTITGKPVLGVTASNNITALVVTTGTCFPAFSAATYSYVVGTSLASVTFTATFAAGTCVLKENGVQTQTLTSGVASAAVTASSTPKTITLEVTQSGKTTTTYTFLLTKTS